MCAGSWITEKDEAVGELVCQSDELQKEGHLLTTAVRWPLPPVSVHALLVSTLRALSAPTKSLQCMLANGRCLLKAILPLSLRKPLELLLELGILLVSVKIRHDSLL